MKLLLVNRHNPLPENFCPCLTEIGGGFQLDRKAASALKKMLCKALENNVQLRVFSAFRTPSYQQGLFNDDLMRYKMLGFSESEAFEKTSQMIAPPMQSEHNTGLAVDISSMNWQGEINQSFDETSEFKWLIKNAPDFGFILRYPKGKKAFTGIEYEPWHYRYVGLPHSKTITAMGITLEEYLVIQSAKCENCVNKFGNFCETA